MFSERSLHNLAGCHPDLVKVFTRVEEIICVEVICGPRTRDEQAVLLKLGKSWTLDSKHVVSEEEPISRALDACPLPINWENIPAFHALNAVVQGVSKEMGIKIIWGGSWKQRDYNHFELG